METADKASMSAIAVSATVHSDAAHVVEDAKSGNANHRAVVGSSN